MVKSTFQGKFNFLGLFNSSTFQACANPGSPGTRLVYVVFTLNIDTSTLPQSCTKIDEVPKM